MMKTCSKCKQEKLITEFHKAKAFKDGHAYRCKDCCKEYKKTIVIGIINWNLKDITKIEEL